MRYNTCISINHISMKEGSNMGKDLTKEAPRSPRERIGGFAIIARTLDKCRAKLWGNIGEYHFDCPVDNLLFGFKGVKGDDFKAAVETGNSDEEMAEWLKQNGQAKTEDEINEWSDDIEFLSYNDNPEKAEWFRGECERLGLDPETTTLFDYLETDDEVSFKK